MRECRYGKIFREFLHGMFDKNGLMKRVTNADQKDLEDFAIVDEISMIDLEGKKQKTVTVPISTRQDPGLLGI